MAKPEIDIDEATGAPPLPSADALKKSLIAGMLDSTQERMRILILRNPELEAYIADQIAEGIAAASKKDQKKKA